VRGKEFCQLISEYKQALKEAEKKADKIGKTLVELLRPYIPDITYTIGGCDEGIETVYFWSAKYREGIGKGRKIKYPLFDVEEIITEIFPELEDHIRVISADVETEVANEIRKTLIRFKESKRLNRLRRE